MLTDSALRALADRFGTPLYVFDDRALVQRVRYLREALPATCGNCFAIKANPFVLPRSSPSSTGSRWLARRVPHLPRPRPPHDKIVVSACIRTSRPYRAP